MEKDRLSQRRGIIVTSSGSLMEPAVAWLLLSAHTGAIVHLSHPNKEPGSSTVQPPSPGMDVVLMLPAQAQQLSFSLPPRTLTCSLCLLNLYVVCPRMF